MYDALSTLSVAAQDLLKAIWTIRELSGKPATVTGIASRLHAAPSTVSEAVRRLKGGGLVVHARYGTIDLTERGEQLALAMVRRLRLLETFLVDHLNYTWDEVQHEADVLEHAVSDKFIERLEAVLGYPDFDPHGDPIPKGTGHFEGAPTLSLGDVDEGAAVRIARIVDAQPDLLRYLAEHGLTIGTPLRVMHRSQTAGVLGLTVSGTTDTISMGLSAARSIRVVSTGSAE
jgi:DtxR family Mn-dependent transcriptional regulator